MTTLEQQPAAGDDWVLADDAEHQQQQQPDPAQQQDEGGAPANPVEALALEMGWTPQEQWRGAPDKFVSAADYIKGTQRVADERGRQVRESRSAIEQLQQQTRAEIEGLRAELQGVGGQQRQIIDAQFNVAMEDIENARFEAYAAWKQSGDAKDKAAFDALTKQKADLQTEYRKVTAPPKREPQIDWSAEADSIMKNPLQGAFFRGEGAWLLEEGGETAFDAFVAEMQEASARGATQAQALAAGKQMLQNFFPRTQGGGQQPQPRDPSGKFTSNQADPPRRGPANIAPAQRVAASSESEAVRAMTPQQRAEGEALIAGGKFRGTIDTYARLVRGEKVDPLSY